MIINCPEFNIIKSYNGATQPFGSVVNHFNNNFNSSTQQPADIAEMMESGTKTVRNFKFNIVQNKTECVAMFYNDVVGMSRFLLVGLVFRYADLAKYFMPTKNAGYFTWYPFKNIDDTISAGILTIDPILIMRPQDTPTEAGAPTAGMTGVNYFPTKNTFPIQTLACYHIKASNAIDNGTPGLLALFNNDYSWPFTPTDFSKQYSWFDLDKYTEDLIVVMTPAYPDVSTFFNDGAHSMALQELKLDMAYPMNDVGMIKGIYANHDVVETLEVKHFGCDVSRQT